MKRLIAVLVLAAVAGCSKPAEPMKVATAPYPPSDYRCLSIPMRATVMLTSEGEASFYHQDPDTNWWNTLVPQKNDYIRQANTFGINDSLFAQFPANGRRFMVYSTTTLLVREVTDTTRKAVR